jgi:hypothetical protein
MTYLMIRVSRQVGVVCKRNRLRRKQQNGEHRARSGVANDASNSVVGRLSAHSHGTRSDDRMVTPVTYRSAIESAAPAQKSSRKPTTAFRPISGAAFLMNDV